MFAQMSYIGARGRFVGLGVGAGTDGDTREGMMKLTLFCFVAGGFALKKRELRR